MEPLNSKIEHEPTPRDISSEFLSMDTFEFSDFLRTISIYYNRLERCTNCEKIKSFS